MLDRCCMGLWIWEKMERSKRNVQTTLYTIIEELIRVFKNILAEYLIIYLHNELGGSHNTGK